MKYINHTFKMAFYLDHDDKNPGVSFIPPENCITNLFRKFIENHFDEVKYFILVEGLKVVSTNRATRVSVSIPLTTNCHEGNGHVFFMHESDARYFASDIVDRMRGIGDPTLSALAKNMVCGTGNIWV